MGILVFNREKKMKRQYQKILKRAMEHQRNGDVQASSVLYEEALELNRQLEEMASCTAR